MSATASYFIAELKDGEAGGFSPRGAAKKLWGGREFETVISGPAETGKTWGALQYVDALLWKYPGAQGVMARKTYAALVGSAVRTYQRIIGQRSPITPYGGEKPEWFDYPNGSRLWIAGLDNPGKALSSERDFVYVNQAEEISLEDWETLATRCTGRGAVMPYTRLFGDCNPGPPTHWIKGRQSEGKLLLLESRHEDNPTLFDELGTITEQGKRSLSILDNLTGTRRLRLRFGKWSQAEGVVYEGYDTNVHLIDSFDIPPTWKRIRSIDFGYTNPFVCQWWAIDGDGRMYLYREIYRTRRLVEDHARDIKRMSEGERFEVNISDHDAEDRATLEKYGISTIAAHKAITPGIEAVSARLRIAGDGKSRLFVMRDSLKDRDDLLVESKLPVCTEQEFECYVYPKGVDGKPVKEEPLKMNDHGMDAARYAVAYLDNVGSMPVEVRVFGGDKPRVRNDGW